MLWEAPRVGVLPAYGGRYSPARPSCGVLSCLAEYPALKTSNRHDHPHPIFWLKSFRSHSLCQKHKDARQRNEIRPELSALLSRQPASGWPFQQRPGAVVRQPASGWPFDSALAESCERLEDSPGPRLNGRHPQ